MKVCRQLRLRPWPSTRSLLSSLYVSISLGLNSPRVSRTVSQVWKDGGRFGSSAGLECWTWSRKINPNPSTAGWTQAKAICRSDPCLGRPVCGWPRRDLKTTPFQHRKAAPIHLCTTPGFKHVGDSTYCTEYGQLIYLLGDPMRDRQMACIG